MLSPKRLERQPRASLLPGVLLCIILATVSARMPAKEKCPSHIDCAQEGRHFCRPGSSHCGPCLTPLEENEEGKCEMKKKHHRHREKVTSFPDLDQEIDNLRAVIAKQQVSQQPVAAPPPPAPAPRAQTDAPRQRTDARPNTATPDPTSPRPRPATGGLGRRGPEGEDPAVVSHSQHDRFLVILISVCILVGTVALVMAAVCWVRSERGSRLAQKVDYPAYGGVTPVPGTVSYMGDKTLAQSAQMYHYQHQKQQMMSLGKQKAEKEVADSGATSEEDEVGGDFTVYECPGLAPTGEMEVKNPLFDDSALHYQGNHK